jgi:hypothetical protein
MACPLVSGGVRLPSFVVASRLNKLIDGKSALAAATAIVRVALETFGKAH